jgi:Tol biopolymer transport system component
VNPDRERAIERICQEALDRPRGERATFLAEACGGDEDLRREVERLLAQESAASAFLATPALAVAAHQIGHGGDALRAGQQIGSYTILSSLGAGGMGEVYRARDTKLGRDVAIKVLQPTFAADPDRMARFEREARLLAALDHPNIGTILGVEESDRTRVLVLALVEGETLAERLARGAIPMPEVLEYARQIADALEAAHDKGIIHRDLKPSNIKVTPSGIVKVLDFGLARAVPGSGDLAAKPSLSSTPGGTRDGVILGTAAYMSPEQARGQRADKRSDVWAFGCVLYEMLTGRVAFARETVSDTITAILGQEVDWSALPEGTSASVRRLLQRCLVKQPAHRLHDIADARLEIEDAAAGSVETPQGRSPWVARLGWIAAALLVTTIVVVAIWARSVSDARTYRTEMLMPAGFEVAGPPGRFALSPDGRRLAFSARDEASRVLLWVRGLDESTAHPLSGTEGAEHPFWSPDSRTIAFFANQKLKKVAASGGATFTICDAGYWVQGGTWNRDDVILFTFGGGPLFRVAADGGTPEQVTTLDAGERGHAFPFFLPDGRHFLYTIWSTDRTVADSGVYAGGVFVGSLDTSARRQVLDRVTNAEYARGHLLFMRDGALVAQKLDPTRITTAGEPVVLVSRVFLTVAGTQLGAFSASEDGVLAFETPTSPEGSQLVWMDRKGRRIGTLGSRSNYENEVELSPDGRYALVTRSERGGAPDLVVLDVSRNLDRRLTFAPEADRLAVWSPDGTRVAFSRRNFGPHDMFVKASDGAASEELLLADEVNKFPESWSPDGRFLLYRTNNGMWVLPMAGDRPAKGPGRPEPAEARKPFPYIKTTSRQWDAWDARFSPDGRWVAYSSAESGHAEVYVSPFSVSGGAPSAVAPVDKWLVSTGTARGPRWRRDGREIFYWSQDSNRLMAVPVRVNGPLFEVGHPEPLFEARPRLESYPFAFYDVSDDGQRFLVNGLEAQSGTPSLALIVNWPALLKN